MIAYVMTTPTREERLKDDYDLAQRAAGGDNSARAEIIDRLLDRVRTTVGFLAAGHPDSDDFAQMACIEILESIRSYRGESSLEAWAERITVRTAMRHIKKHRRRLQVVALDPEKEGRCESMAERDITKRHVSERVAKLLETLKPKQRVAVTMRLLLGYSVEEIAETTDSNVNTVKYRLRIGRGKLRRQIVKDPVLAQVIGLEDGTQAKAALEDTEGDSLS